MLNDLVLKGYEHLMTDTYNRIELGKHFDMNFKPYKEDFIKKVIKFFEDSEDFEKCQTLMNFMNKRFNHDLNYNNI